MVDEVGQEASIGASKRVRRKEPRRGGSTLPDLVDVLEDNERLADRAPCWIYYTIPFM